MPKPGDDLEGDLEVRLDAALRAYTDSSYRPGPAVLAARVLIASRQVTARNRIWLRRGMAGIAACTLALPIVFLSFHKPVSLPQAPHLPLASTSALVHPRQDRASHSAAPRRVASRQVVVSRANESPKLDRFPQPRVLSDQERLMLGFVSSASPAEQQIVAQAAAPPVFMRIVEPTRQVRHATELNSENSGASHEEHR